NYISYIRVAFSCNEEEQRNKTLYLDEIFFNDIPEARTSGGNSSGNVTVNSVIIDASQSYQTIVGFAASDCWTSNYVGQWEGTGKDEIAKYLFSQELDENGSPEGIGLSMWRVNIGAGTLEQGDDSGIDDVSRRTECLLNNSTGEYDWSKQSGQQFFMQKAKEYGCEHFVAFSNSPPLSMTRNGMGYAPGDNQANLKSDKYDDFAGFLTTVVKHFNDEGYNFSYISPVNEPQYDWKSGGQEGTSWQNSEITKLVKEVNTSIVNKELNSKILISEGAEWKYLYEGDVSKRYNQTWAFFGESQTDTYVGDLASVPALIGGHSYWNHGTNTELRDAREKMKAKAEEFNVAIFQTEWSLLGENPGENFPGYDDASYMDIALIQARMIHADMTIANVTSWSYWTAMDMERWGHKNRFLMIAVEPNNTSYPETEEALKMEGSYNARANLWAMGNYSYFIRPGYKRIAYAGPDDLGALMGSAYLAPDSSEIVAVYVNIDESDYNLKTTINGIDNFKVKSNQAYLTDENNALKKMSIDESYSSTDALKIPARSVLTMVYKLENSELSANMNKVVNPNGVVIYPNPTQGKFHVKLKGDDLKKDNILKIYDNTGRLLYSELLESKETEISFLEKAHNGIYYINAFNQLTKLVKAK
nr:T9SS type A sorting domain-containing protein [Bacteroidales bacterium]